MAIKLSEEEYQDLCADNGGYCLKCHSEAYGVEPDARRYECEKCGAHAVNDGSNSVYLSKMWFFVRCIISEFGMIH